MCIRDRSNSGEIKNVVLECKVVSKESVDEVISVCVFSVVEAVDRSSFCRNISFSKTILNITLKTWKSCIVLHTDIFIGIYKFMA